MNFEIRELVTSKRKVLLKVISFISVEKRWYSSQEISKSVGLVDRSVQRYNNYLYDTIQEFNDRKKQNIQLITKKNKGIKLIYGNKENINALERFICESDETILLLMDLLFETYKSNSEYFKRNKEKKIIKQKTLLIKYECLYSLWD